MRVTSPTLNSVLRLAQLLADDLDIVAAQIDNRSVAQNVHISDNGIQQYVLLSVPQLLTLGKNLRIRRCGRGFACETRQRCSAEAKCRIARRPVRAGLPMTSL